MILNVLNGWIYKLSLEKVGKVQGIDGGQAMAAPALDDAPMIERSPDQLKSYVQDKWNSSLKLTAECQGNLAKLPQGDKARQDLGSQFNQLNIELRKINPNNPQAEDAAAIGMIEQQLAELSKNIILSLPIQ